MGWLRDAQGGARRVLARKTISISPHIGPKRDTVGSEPHLLVRKWWLS